MKFNKNTITIFTIFFLFGCGNAELDAAKNSLKFAIADKDHYSIIKHSNSVLNIDPEDIEARAAFRDSARVYGHIREAAENLKKLDEVSFDNLEFKFTMETPNDDPFLFEYALNYHNNNIGEFESNDQFTKNLNIYVAGYIEDDAPSEITDSLKAKFVLLEISKLYGEYIDIYKNQIDYLANAKKSLKAAERLDPRFSGVIDLEEIIEARAELYTNYIHAYLTAPFMDEVTNAASFFDDVYDGTNSKWDQFVSLGMTDMGYGIAEAYSSARNEVTLKDWSITQRFENYMENCQSLLSLYKDLEDEFEDIDSLEPAIELVESMIDIFKYTEASGNLRDWNKAMQESVDNYSQSSSELVNEVETVEKLSSEKEEINSSLDIILDEEIISVVDSSEFI
ncbi:hypothetical protein OAO53_02410 [Gammaproteobacteria bacterium]|nr:hypothetical protein [Gammaproteobacteria bacterium]